MSNTVVRISRHKLTDSHTAALKAAFGEGVEVTPPTDAHYGDDPVAAVQAVIDRFASADTTIVAVEAAGPEPVLMALIEGLSVPVVKPVFRREGSRVVVAGKDDAGRDIFEVERYERLTIEVRPTVVGASIG
jgi:hypothetical protein